MGLRFTNYFEDSAYESRDVKIIACVGCSSHVCLSNLIISDNFVGASGPAYLVEKLINIEPSSSLQETRMRTGTYEINKVRCHQCKAELGWYYKRAYDPHQTYKENKFVIEAVYVKFINNNASTNTLLEQALKNKIRRRYSSTSTISAESIDEKADAFKFSTSTSPVSSKPSPELREFSNGILLNRLRIPGIPGTEKSVEEEDEDEVFVDA